MSFRTKLLAGISAAALVVGVAATQISFGASSSTTLNPGDSVTAHCTGTKLDSTVNGLEGTLTCSGGQPDVIVTSVTPTTATAGQKVPWTAVVKNIGTGPTPPGIVIGVGFQVDGTGATSWSATDTTSLAAGDSVSLTVDGGTVWTAVAGTHNVRAWVDDINRFPESNETNNTLVQAVTVGSVTTTTTTTIPGPTTTTIPPPPGSFGMGFATGYPYGFVTQADVNSMKDMGAKWARFDVPQGQSLANEDALINMVQAAGIKVIGTMIPSQTTPATSAAWAGSIAAHFAPKGVHVWEWRNESNWMGTNVPVATYTAELKAAYTAIHNADPQAIVLEGGSVPALGTASSPENYLLGIYNNGGKGFFDGVSDHPYPFASGTPVTTWPEIDNMTTIHNVLASHGDGAKLVWATEVGLSTITGVASGFTEPNAAIMLTNLVNRLHTLAAQGVAAPMVGYYSERDRTGLSPPRENHFGVIRADLSHKPAYATFKQLAANG